MKDRSAFTADVADRNRFAEIVCRARALPIGRAPLVLERVEPNDLRLVRHGNEVAGGLLLLPMGLWYGGAVVPCMGITYVAIAAEHRSKGLCKKLLGSTLTELYEAGVALSSLYPTSAGLYRAFGYELAGHRFVHRLELAGLRRARTSTELRRLEARELSQVYALYRARARASAGHVERTPYFWQRALCPARVEAVTFSVEAEGEPHGYVCLSQRGGGPAGTHELEVHDCVATSALGARAIASLLAGHGSMARTATLALPPTDPVLLEASERSPELVALTSPMLRIVDVRAALQSRGWPAQLRAELSFELRDDQLPGNAGRWRVEIGDGRAEVKQGGSGALRIDVRGLAGLYAGFFGGFELRAAGLCDGSDHDLAKASVAFAGPTPWTPDAF